MRIAHFSDLHYGATTLQEADHCFAAGVDRAIAERVEAAVVSGDATDHSLELHEPATLSLLTQVRRLADHCPVLLLQGTFSHEPPGTLAALRHLVARHSVYVADRIGQVVLTIDGEWVSSQDWCFDRLPTGACALFSCVPTVNKAQVAVVLGAANAAVMAGEYLAMLLIGFAPGNRRAHEQGLPTVVVSHGTVFGCLSEHGVPMAGFDHEFTTGALFCSAARAVMLGHIHRHQSWEKDGSDGIQRIAYAGSIGRFHFGEKGEKGFLLWCVTADAVTCELMATPARRTVDIVFEGQPDLAALREAAGQEELAGAHVRVRWTVSEEDRHQIDRVAISRLLSTAAHVKLEGTIVPIARARAPGISQLGSLVQKVQRWAELCALDSADILNCMQSLEMQAPVQIAESILQGQSHFPARAAQAGATTT